jgi:hypothetical protein
MIPEFQKAALGCISAGARYDRFWLIVLKKSANWQFGIGQCDRRAGAGLHCA